MKKDFSKIAPAVFLILLLFEQSLFASDCPALLTEAEKYFFQLEYSRSLQALEEFQKNCPSATQPWVVAAQVHQAQGKKKEAVADFEALLVSNPTYTLSAARYPPSLWKIFQEARENFEHERAAAIQQPHTEALMPSPALEPAKLRRRKISKGWIFGGLGVLGAGILAAVLSTQGGGGGGETPAAQVSSNTTGNVAIEFK